MKKELLFVLSVLLVGIALAEERDHHAGPPENHPDFKVFRWGENIAGDCHQVGATLVIRSNGSASFDSNIWTHTHGTDVWHSTVHLRGPGGELGNSGNHDSPGIPHDHDGPGNPVHLHYDFGFPSGNFGSINEAIEHSAF